MPVLPEQVQSDLASTLGQQTDYLQSLASNIDSARQQSDLISQYRVAAPHLPAAAYVALAQQGVDPASDEFAQITRQYMPTDQSNTVGYTDGQVSTKPTTRTSNGHDALIIGTNSDGSLRFAAAGQPGIEVTKDILGALSGPQAQQYGKHVLQVMGLGANSGWSLNPFDDVSHIAKVAEGALKTGVRWTAGGLYYPVEVGQNAYSHLVAELPQGGIFGNVGSKGRVGGTDDSLADMLWRGTDFGQAVAHGGGKGWLLKPPPAAEAEKAQIQRGVRGYWLDPETGQPITATAGRGFAAATGMQPQKLTVDPASLPFNLLSGAVDAWLVTKFDPAVPAQALYSDIRAARTGVAITANDALIHALDSGKIMDDASFAAAHDALSAREAEMGHAGILDSLRRMVHPPTYEQWAAGSRGQRVFRSIADIPSAGELYDRTFGAYRQFPELYRQLAQADTPEAVKAIFDNAVYSGTAGTINQLPTAGLITGLGGAKYALTAPFRDVRWAARFPGRAINPADPAQTLQTVDAYAKNALLSTEARHALLDQAVTMLTANDVTRPNLLHNLIGNLTQATYEKMVGEGWWQGSQARQLGSGLADIAANSPDALRDEVENAVRARFPNAEFTSEQLDDIANRIAAARPGDRAHAAIDAIHEVAPDLGKQYAPDNVADTLSRYRPDNVAEYKKFLVDTERGGFRTISIGDEVHQMDGPGLFGQLHHGEEILPDPRAIRRTISAFSNIAFGANPFQEVNAVDGTVKPRKWIDFLETVTKIYRTFTIARPALAARMIANLQAALGVDGGPSLFTHPLQFLAGMLGAHGETWADMIGDHAGPVLGPYLGAKLNTLKVIDDPELAARAQATDLFTNKFSDIRSDMGRVLSATNGQDAAGNVRTDLAFSAKQGEIHAEEPVPFVNAWHANISQLNADPIARAIAQHMLLEHDVEPPVAEGFTRLYRGEAGDVSTAAGAVGHEGTGRWFTTDRTYGQSYAGSSAARDGGTPRLLYVDVPTAELDKYGFDEAHMLPPEYARAARPVPGSAEAVAASAADLIHRVSAGDLAQYRRELAAAGGWHEHLLTPEGTRAYMDEIADVIDEVTGGRPELLDAIASGRFADAPLTTGKAGNPELIDHLHGLRTEGEGPRILKGPLPVSAPTTGTSRLTAQMNHGLETFFDHLITMPMQGMQDQAIGHYYNEALDRILPLVDPAERAKITDALLTGHTQEYATDATESGMIGAHEADLLAKGYAIQRSKQLMLDLHDRSQFGDMARFLSPFLDHWRQLVVKWAHLGVDDFPTISERLRQAHDWTENNGWFFNDQYGQLNFHVPLSGLAVSAATGGNSAIPPVAGFAPGDDQADLTAPATGLSIATEGMPGIGGVLSIPAHMLLQAMPQTRDLEQRLLPFGSPDTSHGILEAFAPRWAQKIITAIRAPGGQRDFAEQLNTTTSYLQARYPSKYPHTDEGHSKLYDDAKALTQKMYVLRGIAQALLPAAPQVDQKVNQKPDPAFIPDPKSPLRKVFDKINAGVPVVSASDQSVEAWVLAKEFRSMLDASYANGGTTSDAVTAFLARHGENDALLMVPQSDSPIYGLGATQAQADWKSANKAFARANPQVWALFGPNANNDKNFSYYQYARQIGDGERKLLSWDDRVALAEYRIASSIYDDARAQLPATPPTAARTWLEQVRQKLEQEYPGYAVNNAQKPGPSKIGGEYLIQQMTKAANDPRLTNNDVAGAVQSYLDAREQVLAQLAPSGKPVSLVTGQSLSSKQAAPARAWLRGVGATLVKQYPAFAPAWDLVFSHEVEES